MREAEFAEYAAARWPRLVRAAVLLGCDPHEAEDVAQSALVRCLVHWSRVRTAEDRDGYVHRVLVNTLADTHRRRSRSELPTDRFPERVQPDGTGAVDDRDALARSLSRITAEQREAVVLRYYLHLDERQMARVLDVAPGTVKSRLSRALAALAADPALAERGGTDD
ncbi:SigE family RNA polymerase sigma factor [Nocardioides sp. W7]|uniref:SigE family RNA polymerase sigma factor n=1 Tax=Nocardioides sp. W7 TaxID=2931390 RepID=UPI001FD624B6|nr:SigE family RNA polymerase sigma factor [Nocardioides sp. W7]